MPLFVTRKKGIYRKMAIKKKNYTPEGGHIIGMTNFHAKDYGKGERYEVAEGTDDLQALVNLGIQSLRRETGKYPNNPEGLEALKQGIIGYFQYINDTNASLEKQPVYPDIEGLSMYLRTTRKTLRDYEARGGEWAEVIGRAKTAITAVKKQLADSFRIPPILAIFDLTNNAGYVNSSEFRLQAEPVHDSLTPRINTAQIESATEALPPLPEEV